MPWKKRGDKSYFYRSVREGGRVRSVYARGELGECFARLVGLRALLGHADRAKRAAGLAELEARAAAIAAACGRAEAMAQLALQRAGYHRPQRGRWRRRRRMTTAEAEGESGAIRINQPRGLDAAGVARFDAILGRFPEVVAAAQAGDLAVAGEVAELFELTARHGAPGALEKLIELCQGDLAKLVEQHIVAGAAAKDLAQREALRRRLDRMRDELAGPGASRLERMLVDRVVLCWADAHGGDLAEFRGGGDAAGKARDRASRRFDAAVKTLAAVRKLALPDLQVNIAQQQQVNN